MITTSPSPTLLVVAAFSRHEQGLQWARDRLQDKWGQIALASPVYSFHHTKYYESTMGAGLLKQLLAFGQLTPQQQLADIKLDTNKWEQELIEANLFADQRPVNLDPGVLTLGKFILATTKDQAHRIYLRDGIYAEVTLRFQDGEYVPWPWTYADYREPVVTAALKEFRDFYRKRLSSTPS